MRQDERSPYDQALRTAREAAFPPGEFVEQESFMRAGEILSVARRAGIGPGVSVLPLACSDEVTAIAIGTAKITFRMPYAMTLTAVRASLTTAQASGSIFTVAATRPELVRTLTLVSTPVFISDKMKETYSMGHASRVDAMKEMGRDAWLKATNRSTRFPPETDPALLDWYEAEFARSSNDVQLAFARFVVGTVLPFSGHMLFLTYTVLTIGRVRWYRRLAVVLLVETTIFKLWLWRDPYSWSIGLGLGAVAAAVALRTSRVASA